MAVSITRPGKEFDITIEGTTFTLCRLSLDEDAQLQRKFTSAGTLDVIPYAIAKLERGVRGWDTLLVDGGAIKFDRSLIKEFPDWLRVKLLNALDRGADFFDKSSNATVKT